MIIMLYAHARTSGDGTLLAQYVCRVAQCLIDGAETRCSTISPGDGLTILLITHWRQEASAYSFWLSLSQGNLMCIAEFPVTVKFRST